MNTARQIPFQADITSEQIVFSPEEDGIDGIPAISHSVYRTNWQTLPEHTHRGCIELCFCSRGALVFDCEGETFTLMPNNVFLTQPGDRHHLTTNHKGMRMYWLFFRYPRQGRTVLGLSVRETAALVRRLKAIRAHDFAVDHVMRQLFREIFRVYGEQPRGAYRTMVLRTLILRILLITADSAGNRPTLKSLAAISTIARTISRRLSHHFSTAELARRAGLSESHFTALFRKVIGMPPYAYRAKCRLEEAKRRLAETTDSVRTIARDLGFSSSQHLAVQFRKTYGLSAGEWRKSASRPSPESVSSPPPSHLPSLSCHSRANCATAWGETGFTFVQQPKR